MIDQLEARRFSRSASQTKRRRSNRSGLGGLLVAVLLIAFASAGAAVLISMTGESSLMSTTAVDSSADNAAMALQGTRSARATGPLYVHPDNPRYFTDGSGRAIYLTGSHFWLNLQDGALTDPPPPFGYTTWLDFLEAHNHNFFRLWTWEQAKWVVEWHEPFYFAPHPYQRTGPGDALDGKPRFDLTKFNQAYFDRLRQHVVEAGGRGIYVSIMLFDGWSVDFPKGFYNLANPWLGHPFNVNNNINGINGDANGDNSGTETHQLSVAEVTALQEAYVRKVIDTVNDLDNVLYEISNESDGGSDQWQYHMINLIKSYEASKPKQHPVGMTVEWPGGDNAELFASPADWVSPNGDLNNPPPADGSKVVIADTDHLCGICGDRQWVWKSFTRGENPLFMDQYDDSYKLDGGGYDMNNPNDVSLRLNLGYTLLYANRMNLVAMTPRSDLCSTQYCLANPSASGAEYLVYLPSGATATGILRSVGVEGKNPSLYLPFDSTVTVDLSATAGTLSVEWFNPSTGATTAGGTVTGGAARQFTAPFAGDAVLYLYQPRLPIISGVVAHPLDVITLITWNTDRPATSQVDYGLSSTLGMSTTPTSSYVLSHSVVISGLSPDTQYFYRVRSRDASGLSTESEVATFTTLAPEEVWPLHVPVILKLW